MNAPSAQPAR